MTDAEARLILQSCRPGDAGLPQMDEALRVAAHDPALNSWFAEEQAFDRAIAAQLEKIPEPLGLKTRLLARTPRTREQRLTRWMLGFATVAAVVLVVLGGVSIWRAPAQHPEAEYAREMASFIQLPPPLQMENGDLNKIKSWLDREQVPPVQVPKRLAQLDPLGCRLLSFRGHRVTLICFERSPNHLAHLFVVDRAAIPSVKPGQRPLFANENGWMTATWAEGDRVYMIAMQGGRYEVEKYLPGA